MKVVGLLSSQNEAKEIKKIAKICSIEDRIHFLVRINRIKKMMKEERKN